MRMPSECLFFLLAVSKMRFKAQVTVNNRMLSNQGGNCVKVKGKPPVSSLAIGRKPKHLVKDDDNIKDPEVFVLHCTAQNRSGFKYAVKQNIEKVSFCFRFLLWLTTLDYTLSCLREDTCLLFGRTIFGNFSLS